MIDKQPLTTEEQEKKIKRDLWDKIYKGIATPEEENQYYELEKKYPYIRM